MQDYIEVEGNIELQKKRQDETNERKNAVEAYVYGLRNQLSDQLAPFVTEQEQSTVSDKLNQTEVRTAPCQYVAMWSQALHMLSPCYCHWGHTPPLSVAKLPHMIS